MKQTTTVIQQVTDVNEEQLLDLIKSAVPQVYEMIRLMSSWDIAADVVLDTLGCIHTVKESGFGIVQIEISHHSVKLVEGKTKHLYAVERYNKNV